MSIQEFGKISHFLSDYPSKWARIKPNDIGLIDADEGKYITWQQFENMINLYALEFMDMGLQKGDIMITMLPMVPELIFMEYACFKLGIIACPLDVRLKEKEVVKCVELLKKARRILYVHPDDTDSEDKWGRAKFYAFQQIAHAVRIKHSFVQDFIQLGPQEDADWGTIGILNFLYRAKEKWIEYQKNPSIFQQKLQQLERRKLMVDPAKDGAMIIYTTGSTGFPKPAVLSHAGIVCQNMCLVKGFQVTEKDRILVNLPPSHVAGQTVALMSMIYTGAIAVLLHGFRSDKSLQAVQDYKITIFGQIPALFAMEWNLPNYNSYDLSSVRLVIYGAQGVTRPFLEKFCKMAPFMGTGLGMTEACGFTTFIMTNQMDLLQNNIGFSYPITPTTVRHPMKEDGFAGDELPKGEVGEICFAGPQIFLHYFDNEDATKKAISKDGILYTGDMGFLDEKGLHLSGRRKFIMKPKGYQVYPAEVEDHINSKLKDKVEIVAVLGMPHEIFSEAIICYVEVKPGKSVTVAEVMKTTEDLAAYKRPSHVVILGPEEMPLNRTEKTDYMILRKIAEKEIERLRAEGKWDHAKS